MGRMRTASSRGREHGREAAILAVVTPWAVLSSVIALAALGTLRTDDAVGVEVVVLLIGGAFTAGGLGFCQLAAVLLRQQTSVSARAGFTYALILTATWTVATFVFYGPDLRSSIFTVPVPLIGLIAGIVLAISTIGGLSLTLLNARPSPAYRRRTTWLPAPRSRRELIGNSSKKRHSSSEVEGERIS